MLKSLTDIVKDNWLWRKQIVRLALFGVIKKTRGAVLSWGWILIKPALFVFVLWFALAIGMRAGENADPPFFLWLIAGFIPWFYMSEMLGAGADVFRSFSYLVNKVKFPLSGIPTLFNLSSLFVHVVLLVILFVVYFLHNMPLDLYLLQIPLIVLIMSLFFNMYSLLASLISALSRDFFHLVKAVTTPLFWLSGIIFDVSNIGITWIETILLFNPSTFFATSLRDALY